MVSLGLWAEHTYVHVDDCHDRFRTAGKAYSDSCGENLGEAVEADDTADFRLVTLKLEVGGRAGCAPEVQVVVRVVCGSRSICITRKAALIDNKFQVPSRMRKLCFLASSKTSSRRSSVDVTPVGLQPYCEV